MYIYIGNYIYIGKCIYIYTYTYNFIFYDKITYRIVLLYLSLPGLLCQHPRDRVV